VRDENGETYHIEKRFSGDYMDEVTKQKIKDLINEAKSKIPALESALEDARRAGLGDRVKHLAVELEVSKRQINDLERVYG
jgi:hypothetical protein